ncbi:MAG: helix-turn-helix domain-containing protein [Thermoanaerobaculia bacterium]|nr:helix-turn-helix domain-containing protein [Thermoanaerobaculia bacterium]
MSRSATQLADILTLSDAAGYLRLPVETVERQANQGSIPGRLIEGSWRFLRSALEDWLARRDSRQALLQQAGVFADDEKLADLRSTIYADRGRPEDEAGS